MVDNHQLIPNHQTLPKANLVKKTFFGYYPSSLTPLLSPQWWLPKTGSTFFPSNSGQFITFLHACAKTAICNIYITCYCYICARNKYAHQIVYTCHIFQVSERLTYVRCMHIYVPYMRSLLSSIQQGALHTAHIFTYIMDQILLPH